MTGRVEKKFTVADVYKVAGQMLKDEMQNIKNKDLTAAEKTKMDELARALSNSVLKEMDLI